MKRNCISILVLIIYTLVLIFIILSAILVAGQGLQTYKLCVAGTWVCLLLYTFTKFAIFLFLVERIHVVRAPFVRRKKDRIYLACLAMVIFMYGPVIIFSYVKPVINMGSSGRRCNFGIRGTASIPVLAVNMFADLVLTGVFFYLLRPMTKSRGSRTTIESRTDRNTPQKDNDCQSTPVQRNIRSLLWKSLIGSLLIEIPMMGNMIQFVVTKGQERGIICMALCVADGASSVLCSRHLTQADYLVVVWDALVIHWLAFGPSAQAERGLEHSVAASSKALLTRTPSTATPHDVVGRTAIDLYREIQDVRVDALDFSRETSPRVDSSTDAIALDPRKDTDVA